MSWYDVRVVIDVESEPRRLFRLSENGNGKVNLSVRNRVGYAHPLDARGVDAPIVVHEKYSLHTSDDSKEGVNQFHLQRVLSTGLELESWMKTRAIKSTDRWCALYFEQCSNLNKKKHIARRKQGINSNIGAYDPTKLSLLYALYVGRADKDISNIIEELPLFLNYRCFDFSRFRVLLLWTFQSTKSINNGFFIHMSTEPVQAKPLVPPEINTHTGGFDNGLDDIQVIQYFRSYSILARQLYLNAIRLWGASNSEVADVNRRAAYFGTGLIADPWYQRFLLTL